MLTLLLGLQTLDVNRLQGDLEHIVDARPMRVGVAFISEAATGGIAMNDRFPLQSVIKLIVGFAVMDAVDQGKLHLDDKILVRRQDLSLYVQPIAKHVGPKGYRTTIADLVRRAIVDSDSAAADILVRKLGGTEAVQATLLRKAVLGIRIDRDERHLQTEIVGLKWRSEFTDPSRLQSAIARVPISRRNAAYEQYRRDPRDTATPIAMARFLDRLAKGDLLKPKSTKTLLEIVRQTHTGPGRMSAGLIRGYRLGHKTGTSNTWKGVTAATNDVGIVWAPDGTTIAIAAFVADSKAPASENDQVIRQLARTILDHHRR